MLALAQSELPVKPSQLDADPFVLNCPNGTLELRTLHLRAHRREDFLTKVTAAPYVPDARNSIWEGFLARSLPAEGLRAYVQRVAGYALTGSTAEEKLFLVHGPTAGGKSTFLGALRRAWGDYATTADFSTFGPLSVSPGPLSAPWPSGDSGPPGLSPGLRLRTLHAMTGCYPPTRADGG
jgi:putative DNA primase/helicase